MINLNNVALFIINSVSIFIVIVLIRELVNLFCQVKQRSIYSFNSLCFFHDFFIYLYSQFSHLKSKSSQNFSSCFQHRQLWIVQLTAINLMKFFIKERIVITIFTGLDCKILISPNLPCSFITHDFRFRLTIASVTLQEFCKLADVEHIVSNLCMVLINKLAGLNDY